MSNLKSFLSKITQAQAMIIVATLTVIVGGIITGWFGNRDVTIPIEATQTAEARHATQTAETRRNITPTSTATPTLTATPPPSPTPKGLFVFSKGDGRNEYHIEGGNIASFEAGDDLIVYGFRLDNEIPIALLRVVAKNPDTLSAQAILVHENHEIEPNLRVDTNLDQLNTSELVPVTDFAFGYLLEEGIVRLSPSASLTEGSIIEAYKPQLIDGTIVDYISFTPQSRMRVLQVGNNGVIAQVRLVNGDWPDSGTIVAYPTDLPPDEILPVIFRMIEKHVDLSGACPDNLDNEEWTDFLKWLYQLDFHGLSSPQKEGIEVYHTYFINILENPPIRDSDTNNADIGFACGAAIGDLLVTGKPMFADFDVSAFKAIELGYPEVADDVTKLTDILCVQFMAGMELNYEINAEAFYELPLEKRLYVEYLFIWMNMFNEETRTPEVLRAQVDLLCMNPEIIDDEILLPEFKFLHNKLVELSHAITNDSPDIGKVDSEVIGKLLDILPLINLTDEEVGKIGNQDFVDMLGRMREQSE